MRTILFSILLTTLTAPFSFGQSYEQIYQVASQEVKSKIDNNKMTGQIMLSGVTAKHALGLAGLLDANRSELEALLNETTEITDFTISTDLHSIVIFCNASFTLSQIKQLLETLNISVIGNAVEYSLATN